MADLDVFGKLDRIGMILLSGWCAVLYCLTEIGVVTGRVFVPEVTSVQDSTYEGIPALPAGV